MNIHELLSECVRNGIRLAVNDGDLRVYFDGEAPDPGLVGLLRQHKQALLEHLSRPRIEDDAGIPILPAQRGRGFPRPPRNAGCGCSTSSDGAGTAYNMVGAYRIRGAFDPRRMQAALDATVARHEALRTVFADADADGDLQQCVLPARAVTFECADLSAADAGDKAQALERLLQRENGWHFDLAAGPLLRAACADLGDGEWLLLLNVHHVAGDEWSIDILEREIGALYAAFGDGDGDGDGSGADADLPPPAVQYVDYAAWSRQYAQDALQQAQTDYWKQRLDGLPALHGLPLDRPRPPVQVYTGATVRRIMPMSWLQSAQAQCQAEGATLFMYLHAALATVLSVYSGEKDIAVGFPVAGRQRKELESVVGLFVNTLVLRTGVDCDLPFRELLAASRDAVVGALKHRDAPFDTLVDALRSQRSSAFTPLAQIFLTLQAHPRAGLRLPGLSVQALDNPDAPVKFDLQLDAFPSAEGLVLDWRYNRSLFDEASIARMAEVMARLLEASVREPDRPIAQIDLLAPQQRAQLLEDRSRTDAPSPAQQCLHHEFERWAGREPDAVAVVSSERALSYGELNAQANRLAHHLIDQGVRPGDLVAICAQRSLAAATAVLAVLKAGGAYVPLDPDDAPARLRELLADADPTLVLSDAAGRRALGENALLAHAVVDLDERRPVWAGASTADPRPAGLSPRHLACAIYPAGATAAPAGAQNEHRALVDRLRWMQDAYRLGAGETVVQQTSLAADAALWELFWTWSNGATVVLAPAGAQSTPAALVELFVRHDIATAHFAPAALAAFLRADGVERCVGLRRLICSGEALSGASLRLAQQRLPWAAIHRLYGPAETAMDATAWTCPPDFAGDRAPIGRPIANTRVYLLDRHRRPLPPGAVGELHIGGAGIGRGYLNRPELTAERFVPDPFAADPAARMYRSGERARYRPDGELECLGRSDRQLRLRGLRIEPGDIEARLAEHPAVQRAVVLAPGDGERKRLVAYLVVRPGHAGDLSAELRAFLASTLPDYMTPAAFVMLDALPLTSRGELDRDALPAPDDEESGRGHAPPQAGIESALAGIWCELLGQTRIGRDDHFFELGGNSLLAVRLLGRVEAATAVRLPLAEFFAHPTLAGLAQAIDRRRPDAAGQAGAIVASERGAALPLSFSQQRLWFLAQIDGADASYHIPAGLRLRGRLDGAALRRALDTLLDRHEALRTVFATVDGQPQARLLPAGQPFALREHDLRARADAPAALDALVREEALATFDLAGGPLIRGRLLRLGESEHVLLITQHHIVSDGWSLGILIGELGALYNAFARGRADPLPRLQVQYPDYAAWQRRWFTPERLSDQFDYWQRSLADAPALLTLPTDRPRSATPSRAGASVPIAIDAALAAALKRLSQRNKTTLFTVLMAAWAAVLARLSGQDDVVVGTPSANRGRQEIEPLVGFFVNTLPLRIDLSGDPSVAELLQRMRAVALSAQDHQDVPFEQIVERLNPARQLEYTPLFQVMFAWQNNKADAFDLTGLQVEPMAPPMERIKFDLELNLGKAGDAIRGSLGYATDLFDAATIERQAGYFLRMLAAMAAADDAPVAGIDLLAADERALLEGWNRTEAPYPADRCIHQLFEQQVRRTPDAVALASHDRSLSYRELNAQANRLAHYLIEHGVRPDDRVAICLERSFAMVVGLLAVLKAGGAYVPIDPGYPRDRVAAILADADPAIALVDRVGRASLGADAAGARDLLDLDAADPAWSDRSAADPEPAGLSARNLAYVIYTSGSTGTPKGVQNEHRGVVNRLAWMPEEYRLGAGDTVLQKTSFGFDVSVWEFFWPLLHGATLALAPPDAHKDPAALIELIVRHRVTTVHFVPSMLAVFLQADGVERCAGLRRVICSGEALPGASVRLLHKRLPQTAIHNLYGPTEAAIEATAWTCPRDFAGDTVPIGRPIANARIYLLDPRRQPVPLGAVGELYIGGVGVARGYLNRPELTDERFLPDPFAADPDARMYRSGDLARHLAGGDIEFLGRNDHQVKLRGFRIELGEIETRLAAHAEVRETVVLALGEGSLMRLVAYVVAAQRGDERAREPASEFGARLRAHLAAALPEYMIPAAFVALDALPLTPSGKLDRRALPAPADDAFSAQDYEPPQGETELRLAALWQELLDKERVGRHDHFFAIGGHSLLAIRLLSRIASNFAVELPLLELFAHPSLAALAARIAERTAQRRPSHAEGLPPIAPSPRDGALALSFAQQRLWFLAQIEGVSASYHMPGALRLRGPVDATALRRALDALLARHESLRTVFATVDGQPQARLLPAAQAFPLSEHDLSGEADPEAAAAALAHEEVQAPFDLAAGPLIRGRLLRLGEAEHVLLITQHHIVSDGWSLAILIDEVGALYSAFVRGRADPLPPLAVQYPEYAAWQRRWFTPERLGGQLDYWQRQLADAPVLLSLPTDRPRSAASAHAGASVAVTLDAALAQSLRRLSQRHNTTLFMTLMAAWAAVLARLSGQDDIVVGTPSANRGRQEIEPLVGFFVNTLPLRIDLSGDPSVAELLARVRGVALAAQDHQDVPFEQIVERINPPRSLEHAPLFQVLFDWQNNEAGAFDLPDLQVEPMAAPFDRVKFDLELSLGEAGEAIEGHLAYAADLFDAATIERHVGYLRTALAAMAAHADAAVARIDLLAPNERTLLLDTWNRTDAPYPADRCVHHLFEQQVQRDPDAVALVVEGRSLSYARLNAQANQLAHYLIARGVRPDDRVAVCAERSFALIVGLLAVLKAGAAYVPFDPAYSSERAAQILADAAPKLVLADRAGRAMFGEQALRDRGVLDLEQDQSLWFDRQGNNPEPAGLHSGRLAYLIYTSGSTGTPKGVMIEHRNVCALIAALQSVYSLSAQDRILQFSSPSFDASVEEIFATLATGATLVLRNDAWLESSAAFVERCARHEITGLSLSTSFWAQLADAWSDLKALPKLRQIVMGGEAVAAHALKRWFDDAQAGPELLNAYGPTETTVDATLHRLRASDPVPSIGRPLANTRAYLLDRFGQPVPLGAVGELFLAGACVGRGYLNRPELTAERFLADPFVADPEARMYRTGDLVRYLADGTLEFLGRNDHQIKLRGFRIELGEIEARLAAHPAVREAVVLALGEDGDKRLVAYVVADDGERAAAAPSALAADLRAHLAAVLPGYMVPAAFVALDALPMTVSGKLDRKALPAPDDDSFARSAYQAPQGEIETRLVELWQTLLGLERVGIHDNFFDVGGTSLAHRLAQAENPRRRSGSRSPSPTCSPIPPSPGLRAGWRRSGARPRPIRLPEDGAAPDLECDIAVIGMAGRFPDAPDVAALWANIAAGVESRRRYTAQELRSAGVDQALIDNPDFVPVRTLLDKVEDFDAAFFGFTPREAEVADPQQRILLECAHEALESAGYGDAGRTRPAGVFVGVGENHYLLNHLLPQIESFAALGGGLVQANSKDSNSKDFAATRISYKLNLSGPSVNVNTACSTSLGRGASGFRSLALARAGWRCRRRRHHGIRAGGYLYEEGNINSPDGHCRTFDRDARGTRSGNGAGMVLLKRLDHALADGDTVHAVIKGSAINNDGSDKVGYTAPSVAGQAQVVRLAHRNARVAPASIQYVEAHGTGTVLGDPIEIRALTEAFAGAPAQRCAIGSVKPNIGHLDTAAGVTGLIKTVQALRHRQLPPSINYAQANPQIDSLPARSTSTPAARLAAGAEPRRAGVSSFGIGGTNAHVVLEEAPATAQPPASRPVELLPLSARSAEALQVASQRLADYLGGGDAAPLADVAHTLQTGRSAHGFRRSVACASAEEAIAALTEPAPETRKSDGANVSLVWMFPGQGTQRADMARDLYASEPVFRDTLDACADLLREPLGADLRELLFPPPEQLAAAQQRLTRTELAQPALFAVEYSLAKLLQSWGCSDAMIGHSLGEYVAACLAGVFSLHDGLKLVAARGRLMQAMPAGRMLSVPLDEQRLQARLAGSALSIAAVNEKDTCVVSGPPEAVAALREQLTDEQLDSRELDTSHAFHSAMMEPMLDAWREVLKTVSLHAPTIPYASNLSGALATADQATDPEYWVRHLRGTVRFADGLDALLAPGAALKPECVLIEVGPGQVLSSLARRRLRGSAHVAMPALGRSAAPDEDARALHRCLAQLWQRGLPVDWSGYRAGERRRRVPLPTYPFERRRFWVEPTERAPRQAAADARKPHHEDWFYVPMWRLRGAKPGADATLADALTWVVMGDRGGIGERLSAELRRAGQRVVVVRPGDAFVRLDQDEYALAPDDEGHYGELAAALQRDGLRIDRLVTLWSLDPLAAAADADAAAGSGSFERFEAHQRNSFCSLMFAIKALMARLHNEGAAIHAVTQDAYRVTAAESPASEQAAIVGLCKVAPQEYPTLRCQHIDFSRSDRDGREPDFAASAAASLFAEVAAGRADKFVAFRRAARWTQTYEQQKVAAEDAAPRFRRGGVYVITGALGKVAYALADHLASMAAKLVMVVRDDLPPRSVWANWIAERSPGDPIVPKLGRLLALECKGAQLLVCKADVTDEAQMLEVFEQAEVRYSRIDGVIHCAGQVRESVAPLSDIDLAHCREQFLPKVKGAMVLQRVLKHRDVDFCVLMSSLSAVLGGLGFAAYAGANACLDAFAAARHAQGDERWLSIDWDGWKFPGEGEDAAYGVSAVEGAQALAYALSWADLPQLVHSTADLKTRMDKWVEKLAQEPAHMRLYVRGGGAATVAPSNTIEFQLLEIWQQLLGIQDIGVRDAFFEAGGDSLLATIMVARINKAFGVNLPIRIVFEEETIERIALQIDELTKRPPQGKPLALKSAGDRDPLFCVHPGSRFGRPYLAMLRHLPADLPVYALEAPGLNDDDVLPETIGDMCSDYIDQIQAIQPHGPYQLLGWSFGAIVAHAMAAEMQKRGLPVAKLIMIDASPLDEEPWPEDAIKEHRLDLESRLSGYKDYQDASDELKQTMISRMSAIQSNNIRLAYYRDPPAFHGDALVIIAKDSDDPDKLEMFKDYLLGDVVELKVPYHHNILMTSEALENYAPHMRDFLNARHPRPEEELETATQE
uniref:Nonribosomal peptide synthetase-polyketide synthase hybrid n=1 Tax=Lysobacter lactamgenus TaxID=39596 RepID=Q2XNF8_LYSLA|nr:nonribosomal peptide synthetase - polyketide synthase hybrid [Lysobacter lactamgenus]